MFASIIRPLRSVSVPSNQESSSSLVKSRFRGRGPALPSASRPPGGIWRGDAAFWGTQSQSQEEPEVGKRISNTAGGRTGQEERSWPPLLVRKGHAWTMCVRVRAPTWSRFLITSTWRSCSDDSTLSILCMSLMSSRWDSRNWSFARCHVCFSWLCCCRSDSSL